MHETTVQFALAIFALPALGLLVGIGATIAQRRRAGRRLGKAGHAMPRLLSINLSARMAEAVQARVDRGDYASVDAVIVAGLDTLFAQERRAEK